MLAFFKKSLRLMLTGINNIKLYPTEDYSKYISSINELNQKAWQLTGKSLRYAMDKVGNMYGAR